MLACPACAGGFALAMGAILGVSALAVKSLFLASLAAVLGGLWIRNIWRRRGEEACANELCDPAKAPTAEGIKAEATA